MTRIRRAQCHLVGLLLLVSATTALKCPDRDATPGREILCYTSRGDLELLENAVCRCTTLVHQGHDLRDLDASEVKSLRDAAQEANPGIRVVLSVGDERGILKSSAKAREEAASRLTDILREVDGVELNVTLGSKERLVTFVKGLKTEMANKSLEKMILLSLPTKPEDLAKQFELKELSKYVDLFTVATHYLRDSDEAYRAFHPSRLMGLFDMLNTDSLVDLISGMGAPKRKILISVPVSAYRFTLKRAQDNTPRSLTVDEQPAVLDRRSLCDSMSDGEWTVERDEDLTAPYAFRNTTWIAFEDETSLKIKGKYVILRELAGVGLRDVENDLSNDCGIPVAQAVQRAFTEMKRKSREVVLSSLEKDLKGTEISYPRHVRSSNFRIVRVVDTAGKIRAVRENTQTAFGCPHQGYFVHPKSCNRFYRCVKFNQDIDDFSVFEFDCPAGLAFDDKTEVCSWPGSISRGSACPGSSEIEPVPRGRFHCPSKPGYYADPYNCRWFFACYDLGGPEMVPYEFRCPFGLVFDEHRLVCEWPWKVPNCNGPGHGDGHNEYAYGNSYTEHIGPIPQGGIIGQGGFVGQVGYTGEGFDSDVFGNQGGHGTAYNSGVLNEQNTHFANAFVTGVSGSGQAYDAAGAGEKYDHQFYDNAGTSGASGHGGQIYNAGQGFGYDGQTYNAGGIHAGAGFAGQTYNSEGTGADPGYSGQTYNSANEGAGYKGQVYIGGSAGIGTGNAFDVQTQTEASNLKAPYDDQKYNAGNTGTGYDEQSYNAGSAFGSGAGYDAQTDVYKQNGVGHNEGRPAKPESDGPSYSIGGVIPGGINYDIHNYPSAGPSKPDYYQPHFKPVYEQQYYDGPAFAGAGVDYYGHHHNQNEGTHDTHGAGCGGHNYDDNGQNYNGNGAPANKDVNFNDRFNDQGSSVTNSAKYDDRGGQSTIYSNDEIKNTQFNAAGTATTAGVNKFAGNTRVPTGFTGGPNNYANGLTTNYAGGVTNDYTGGVTTSGQTVTSQNKLVTGERYNTNFAQSQYPNYNNFGSTAQTGLFDGSGTTLGIDLDRNGKTPNPSFSTIIQGNTGLFNGGINGPKVYNSTFSPNAGYPTSTIIPFVQIENTVNPNDDQGLNPVNSMGLSSTETFSTEYTNQAEKSFATQGRIPAGFAFNGRTQNNQNFNTATNIYDNSKANLAGVTPSITIIRDGTYNNGAPNFGSTISPNNFNTAAGQTNDYENSQIIGSSITTSNNLITRYPSSTDNFNQAGFRTEDNSATSFNQKTTANQNPYVSVSFTQTPQNPVTPSTIGQNFNNEVTPVPGVIPLTNSQPSVDLDNSGITGNKFRPSTTIAPDFKNTNFQSTTPQYYRPNEYLGNNGRGTIRYQNGAVTNKVTETDIPDYRTPYTRIPNSFIINDGNTQSTIQRADTNAGTVDGTYTVGGFTKTGPTKTGITTAQVGGSGSYVFGPSTPRPQPNPNFIGEQAFAGSFGPTGSVPVFRTEGAATNFGERGNGANFGTTPGAASFNSPGYNFGTAGTTNFNTEGAANNFGARGPVNNFGTTAGAANFNTAGSNFGTAGVPNYNTNGAATNFGPRQPTSNFGTTAAPADYDSTGGTGNFGSSQFANGYFTSNNVIKANTVSGTNAETDGYSYPKPLVQLELGGISTTPGPQRNTFNPTTSSPIYQPQPFRNQNSVIIETAQDNRDYSTTISPVGFTTGPLENFRTTVYAAAKLPQAVTIVRPVLDTGSRTVVSTTPIPAIISTQRPPYQTDKTRLDFGLSFDQGSDYGAVDNIDYSDITPNTYQSTFGQRISGQPGFISTNYPQNTVKEANGNSPIITSTQDFNLFTGSDVTAQTASSRSNEANGFRSTVNIPSPVYIPSTTPAPEPGVTFRTPIISAEFGQSSTAVHSENLNAAADFTRRTGNQFLSNQASTNAPPQTILGGVLKNQASEESDADEFTNNQAAGNFGARESINGMYKNRAGSNFAAQGQVKEASGNQASANFGSRGSTNGIYGTQGSGAFDARVSAGRNSNNHQATSYSNQNQGFSGQTRTLIGSNVVTSIGGADLNSEIIRQNAGGQSNIQIVADFNNDAKFGPRNQQSTTVAPEITTYAGDYSRVRSRVEGKGQSDVRNQNRKVIVKLSDLHPLILNKLGAECTCRADPFAVFRGPNRPNLPINSRNRGPVDLANYDESDIYVDVDSDKENEKEIEFAKNIPSSRIIKTSNTRINKGDESSIIITSRGESVSSSYLPPTTAKPPSTYLPPQPARKEYVTVETSPTPSPLASSPRSRNLQPLLIRVDEKPNGQLRSAQGRAGKALINGARGSPNNLKGQEESPDRYGPAHSRSNEETLEGSMECVRPGLFRHPKFCNKFYACHWDEWKKRYTLHVFNCPVHLAFDASAGACNYPSKGPACQDNKLLL